jgi:hypothetical protein
VLCGVLLAAVVLLRRARLAGSGHAPLEFEDSLPDDVTVIPFG